MFLFTSSPWSWRPPCPVGVASPPCLLLASPDDIKLEFWSSCSLWVWPIGKEGRLYRTMSPNSEAEKGIVHLSWHRNQQFRHFKKCKRQNRALITRMQSAFAASFSSLRSFVLVPLLKCSLPDPLGPTAASSAPGLLGAHPRQRGPSGLIVLTEGLLAGKIRRHARV